MLDTIDLTGSFRQLLLKLSVPWLDLRQFLLKWNSHLFKFAAEGVDSLHKKEITI